MQLINIWLFCRSMSDDSNSSPLSSPRFKTDASKWNLNDLTELEVSYNNEETDLSEFMSKLKIGPNQTPLSSIPLSVEYEDVKKRTQEVLEIFEFDFSSSEPYTQEQITTKKELAEGILTNLQSHQEENAESRITEYQRYQMF